jgi:putative transposase
MWKALVREGEQVGRGRVERLMRRNGIQGAKRRGKPWRTTVPDLEARRRPDLVQRDFNAAARNELWVADFTYLRCWEGLVFFAFVVDAYSREVVGWQFAAHMRTDLVLDALRMALAMTERVDEVKLVHHSDAGSQYTSYDYSQTLDDHQVLASIGSVGDAYDNCLMESIIGLFKTECIRTTVFHAGPYRQISDVEYATAGWVDWYNQRRLHSSLGYLSPVEYEQAHYATLNREPQPA